MTPKSLDTFAHAIAFRANIYASTAHLIRSRFKNIHADPTVMTVIKLGFPKHGITSLHKMGDTREWIVKPPSTSPGTCFTLAILSDSLGATTIL